MPELPEVETVRRVLEPQLVGRTILRLTANRPEIISHPTADVFARAVAGAQISGMGRRGKFLMIALENGGTILLHLRMTGCLLVAPPDHPLEKHTHLIFHLDNDRELRFLDTRRFGRFWLIAAGEKDTYSGVEKLGLEPFDAAFSAEYLQRQWAGRKRPIKTCLLDQSAAAGIGNIYSDEILFAARLHPLRPASSLSAEEWNRLAAAIPERLLYFIEKDRLTPEEYFQSKGQDYRNTPFLQVYGHSGKPCPVCGASLCQITVGGRSSVFCPNCQKI